MSLPGFDLHSLLRPVSSEDFFAQYWERQPLLLQRGDPAYYGRLVTLADLEAFLSRGDARYPAIRLAKGGSFYAAEVYTQDFKYGDETFRGMPDLEKIHAEYSSGATLSLPAWHLAWPPLGRLCAQVEAQLDHSVNSNVYLTPARAAGFTPHYDTHEVFVLQIAGRKHWRVYSPPLSLPHRSQTFPFERYVPPTKPLMEFELAAGDLLYLPRGYVHTTTTSEQPSAHVTIGITVYTWVELLYELLQLGIERPEFRQALPPGFTHDGAARALLSQRLPQLLHQLSESIDVEALSERFVERVTKARPRLPLNFRADTTVIGADTRVRIASSLSYSILTEQDSLVLLLNGRRICLQLAVRPTLEAMVRLGACTPRALPADISIEARLSLVRYLYGLGFLELD